MSQCIFCSQCPISQVDFTIGTLLYVEEVSLFINPGVLKLFYNYFQYNSLAVANKIKENTNKSQK